MTGTQTWYQHTFELSALYQVLLCIDMYPGLTKSKAVKT